MPPGRANVSMSFHPSGNGIVYYTQCVLMNAIMESVFSTYQAMEIIANIQRHVLLIIVFDVQHSFGLVFSRAVVLRSSLRRCSKQRNGSSTTEQRMR